MRAITGGIAARSPCCSPDAGAAEESAAPSGEGGTTKLAVQETAGVPSAFVAFGIEKGFFDKQKLEIDLQPTQGGAATIPALVSGDIQVGGSNVVSLLLASSKDLPIRAIAGGTSAQAGGREGLRRAAGGQGQGDLRARGPRGQDRRGQHAQQHRRGRRQGGAREAGRRPRVAQALGGAVPGDGAGAGQGLRRRGVQHRAVRDPERRRRATRCSATPTSTPSPTCRSAPTRSPNQFAESDPDAVKAFQAAVKETADYVAGHEDEFRTFLSESAKMPPKLAKKIVLPKWTGEVDADSVANTAQLMQTYGVVEGEIDTVEAPAGRLSMKIDAFCHVMPREYAERLEAVGDAPGRRQHPQPDRRDPVDGRPRPALRADGRVRRRLPAGGQPAGAADRGPRAAAAGREFARSATRGWRACAPSTRTASRASSRSCR